MHVVHAQQVEAGEQTAEDRPERVAPIESPEPRDAARAHLHPARNRGQRSPHHHGWRQQTDRRKQPAQQQPWDAVPDHGHVDELDQGHRPQHQDPGNADRDFENRVDPQGMALARDKARQPQAA